MNTNQLQPQPFLKRSRSEEAREEGPLESDKRRIKTSDNCLWLRWVHDSRVLFYPRLEANVFRAYFYSQPGSISRGTVDRTTT